MVPNYVRAVLHLQGPRYAELCYKAEKCYSKVVVRVCPFWRPS